MQTVRSSEELASARAGLAGKLALVPTMLENRADLNSELLLAIAATPETKPNTF